MLGTRTRKKAHRGLLYCTSCILLWSRCLSNYLFLQFQDSYKTQNPTSNMEKGQTQGGLFTVQQQDGQCPAEEVSNFLSDYQRKNRNYQVVAYFANTSVRIYTRKLLQRSFQALCSELTLDQEKPYFGNLEISKSNSSLN